MGDVHALSCPHVGDPLPPRRAGARGPGIQLGGDADPTSIDIFKVDAVVGDSRDMGAPTRMIGYFGVITGSNGATYVLNVDNDDWFDTVDPNEPVGTAIPLDIANQLRDAVPHRAGHRGPSCEPQRSNACPDLRHQRRRRDRRGDHVQYLCLHLAVESTRFDGTYTRTLPTLRPHGRDREDRHPAEYPPGQVRRQ